MSTKTDIYTDKKKAPLYKLHVFESSVSHTTASSVTKVPDPDVVL